MCVAVPMAAWPCQGCPGGHSEGVRGYGGVGAAPCPSRNIHIRFQLCRLLPRAAKPRPWRGPGGGTAAPLGTWLDKKVAGRGGGRLGAHPRSSTASLPHPWGTQIAPGKFGCLAVSAEGADSPESDPAVAGARRHSKPCADKTQLPLQPGYSSGHSHFVCCLLGGRFKGFYGEFKADITLLARTGQVTAA